MSTTLPAVRATTPRRRPAGTAERAHASDYTALAREIRAAGLLERRPVAYLLRCLGLAAAFALTGAAALALNGSWWVLVPAAVLGLLFTQAAFLGHDGAHRQVFESGRRNELFAIITANLVVGLGYGWWMTKHSKHHANPNTVGRDGDLKPGAVVFLPDDAHLRHGLAAWLTARQGWYFIPILLLSGLDLHVEAIKTLVRRDAVKHRALESVLIGVRLIGLPVLAMIALGPIHGLAVVGVQLGVFGLTMGGSFAPNHTGMPVIAEHESVDYLRRQVLTSRNISGGLAATIAMGGLNYQVEHHLFPSMPSMNLRRARPIVRRYCEALGVPYTEMNIVAAYRVVLRYLHRVGIRHADPFNCPLAARLRVA